MSSPCDASPHPQGAFLHDQRLRSVERLLKRADFLHVQRRGRRAASSTLTVQAVPNGLEWSRLGVTVSKKVDKRAVVRNRWKRLLREAFRCNKHQLPVGFDLVVLVAHQARPTTRDEVVRELLPLIERLARQFAKAQREAAPKRASPDQMASPSHE